MGFDSMKISCAGNSNQMLARKGSSGMSDAAQVLQPGGSGVHTSDECRILLARARASDGFSI